MDHISPPPSISEEKKTPLFRSVNKLGSLRKNPTTRTDGLRMIKRRALADGLSTCCHTFRAAGITAYLEARRKDRKCPSDRRRTSRRERRSFTIRRETKSRWMTWSGLRFRFSRYPETMNSRTPITASTTKMMTAVSSTTEHFPVGLPLRRNRLLEALSIHLS